MTRPIKASRLLSLPPYLFEELENRCRDARAEGRDIIDLSIGDPDLSPPGSLLEHLGRALLNPDHHRYPPQRGTTQLKDSVRRYLLRRCGVEPRDDEILILVGSKEGLAHLPWAVCDPGDTVLLPDPGYPVYYSSAVFAGCETVTLPLDPDNGFKPDFDSVSDVKARLCILNYPNNPTSATVEAGVFENALALTESGETIVANDAAYADVYFDGVVPPLLCGIDGALERPIVEMFSFSKTYCITGWRVGFAVGNSKVIDALAHMKANIDSGVFGAIQAAVAATLDGDGDAFAGSMRSEFQARRDAVVGALDRLGFQCFPTCATFYVWVRVPSPWNSMDYALDLLEKANVLVTPGVGFGKGGEGYFRISLTRPVDVLAGALDRIGRI